MCLKYIVTENQNVYFLVFETNVFSVMEEIMPNIPKTSKVRKFPG